MLTVSTVITYQQVLPVPANQSVDTVRVGITPGQPNIVYDSANYIVYTDSSQYILQWHLDTLAQPGQVNPTDSIFTSGNYFVMAYNNFGCSSSSDTIYITYCDPSVSFNLGLDGAFNMYITDYLAGYSINWYVDGQLDPNNTSNLFTPSVNGDYQAMLTSIYGCKYYTNVYTFNSVGMLDKKDYWIYPNPANHELTILWPQSKSYNSLSLLDLNGKLIKKTLLNSSLFTLNTSKLENGIYILTLKIILGNQALLKLVFNTNF